MSFSSSGLGSRFFPCGILAWKPDVSTGVTIMKMMSSTSITSIIGVTLMSDLTPVLGPAANAIGQLLLVHVLRGGSLLGLEFLGEYAAAELAADALDEEVDQLLRRVGHLDREVLDLGLEVVEDPHRRDRHHQTERRRDQRLGDTGRDRRQTAGARDRHARKRRHDTHRG